MKIGIIGSSGFVGHTISDYFKRQGFECIDINRQSYDKQIGTDVDCLINSNGSGLKWKANENPRFDFKANVDSTMDYVFDFKFKIFIHISSIDVYSDTKSIADTSESQIIDPIQLHPYGFDKFLSELIVQKYCTNWLILRLGGLVGPNLQKNPIYDWTHDKPFIISKDSNISFIHIENVAKVIHKLINENVVNEIFNVCSTDSITLTDLSSIADLKIEENKSSLLLKQEYNIDTTKLLKYFDPGTSRGNILKYLKENLEISL